MEKHQNNTQQEKKTNSKECPSCKTVKHVTEFYTSKASKDGRQSYCKKCHSVYSRERRERKPESNIYHHMVHRSIKKGFEHPEWTEDEIRVIIQGCCEVTGIPFVNVPATGDDCMSNALIASPDRIDNTKGYTKENTRWVVLIFNLMRRDFPDEQVKIFIEALCKHEINF